MQYLKTPLLAMSLGVTLLLPTASRGDSAARRVPDEVLVGIKRDVNPTVAAASLGAVGRITGVRPEIRAFKLKLPRGLSIESAVAQLRRKPEVEYAEPNFIRTAVSDPNDPYYSSGQYGPQKMQANLAWDNWVPRQITSIAILDTGVQGDHPDLSGVMLRDASGNIVGFNALNGTSNAADDHGHGTHVAGTAAARINNGQGVAGIAGWNPGVAGSENWIKIMPIKVLDSGGRGPDSAVADGMMWAADHGARVISMSLGDEGASNTLQNAANYAWSKGVVVVAAAGNNGSTALFYPAACDNVISVAATDSTDKLASFSNYGPWVDVAAPGVGIISTYPGSSYTSASGTSMACPHISGAVAAAAAHFPGFTNFQLSNLITTQTDSYTPYNGGIAPGGGRANIHEALLAPGNGGPVVPPAPTGLAGVAAGTGVKLTWRVGWEAQSCKVKRATTQGGPYTTIASGLTKLEYTDSSIATNTRYYYVVTASSTAGESPVSNEEAWGESPTGTVLSSITLSPSTVAGGQSSTGTVTLSAAAPSGGATVSLSTSNIWSSGVPSSVTIPAGQTSANFTVTTVATGWAATITISGNWQGISKSATLNITTEPPPPPPPGDSALASLTLNPSTVAGGQSSTGTVTLSAAAPNGGATVALSTSNPWVASVPASVTIPAGQSSANFTVSTAATGWAATITVTGSWQNVSKSASLNITTGTPPPPPPGDAALSSFTINPSTVIGGNPTTGTVTLSAAAPAGGAVVTISNPNIWVFSVPSTVTVPAGQTSASFQIGTTNTGWPATVTFGATLQGITKNAVLNVVY